MGITDKAADILDASFQLTESSVEFFTDVLGEFVGTQDDYDGLAGTIWGSWNDNVLGEGGVVESAIGPEGVGGEIIEAIPESIRKSTGPIFSAAFDAIDVVYETVIDRPIAATVTLLNAGINEGLVLNYLDPKVWQEVNKIVGIGQQEGGGRSTGQAVALFVNGANILDPTEIERIEGTSGYKLASGLVDGAMQWFLDPSNLVGKGVNAVKAKKIAELRSEVANGNYKLLLETEGYGRFKSAISDVTQDIPFSQKFREGKGYTKSDEILIAELAVRLQKAAAQGKLGRGFLNLSYDDARTYAALAGGLDIGRSDQAFDYMIRIQLGDVNAIKDMEVLATSYVNGVLDNGLYDELTSVNKELNKLDELESALEFGEQVEDIIFDPDVGVINAGTTSAKLPPDIQKLVDADPSLLNVNEIRIRRKAIRDGLNERQRVLEEQLFIGDFANMPFAAALLVKEERLYAMAQQYGGRTGHYGIDAVDDVLNSSGDLVTAAVNEILVSHNVNILDPLPSIGGMNAAGIATKTYVTKSQFGQSVAANKVVRLIVEKTPHQIMNWDDPAQQYATFDRMLRDANNVNFEGLSLMESVGLVPENVLGEFMELGTKVQKQQFFDNIVSQLNNGLPKLFNKHLSEFEINGMSKTLQRQYGKAQDLLREKAQAAKTYGNRDYTKVDYASPGEIISRYIPMTPAQLNDSTLVPRYDLYQQAFGTMDGMFDKAGAFIAPGMAKITQTTNQFTNLWKKSVLIRPAWPMRVLIDEVARTAATVGAQEAIKGLAHGFNDLRVSYFRKSGIDIGQPIFDRMLSELFLDAKNRTAKWDDYVNDPWELVPADYAEILEAYNDITRVQKELIEVGAKVPNPLKPMQELVEEVISDQYGAARVFKRASMATGLGLFLAGPAGAAGMGALYSLYARNTLKRTARIEVNTNQMFVLRNSADQMLTTEINKVRNQISELASDDVIGADKLIQEIKDLETSADLLKNQAKNLDDHQKMLLDDFKETNAQLYNNFDKAGQLAAESRYGNFYKGGYSVDNAFGGTATDVGIYRSAISSDNSNRQIWEGASLAQRKATQQIRRDQIDLLGPTPVTQKQFDLGWNDTVNRQWIPKNSGGPFQDFMRMFWDGSTDQEIFSFLQKKGSVVRDAYPAHFQSGDVKSFIETIRTETQSIIPNLPEFDKVRARAAAGLEISWERDMMPVVNRFFKSSIEDIRTKSGNNDFGKIVSDTQFTDMVEHKALQVRISDQVDSIFESLGTMPTDALTRSTVFRHTYETEVSRQLSGFKGDGTDTFRLTNKDVQKIESRARQKAISETKNLLYDLAERSRFEEVAANLMPFYGAWQEVITRWTGIGIDNPYLVAQTIRNWRLLEAEDENGKRFAVIRFPSIFGEDLNSNFDFIPFSQGKVFGKLASFTEDGQVLDFNLKSASMIGGTPGFGPLLTYPVGEAIIANPNLEKTMKFAFPYGVSEGSTAFSRWLNSIAPAFGKAAAGGIIGLNTTERAKTLLRLTGDLAAEYEASGETISSEADLQVFEEEVQRRTGVILDIRLLGTLISPLSFRIQSPHYKIIDEYHNMSSEKGLEAADNWLMHNHSDLWAITGRQTAAAGVASGTLQGAAMYEKHKQFMDSFPEIQDVVLGRVGARDVQFEYSQAVAIQEMADGRRETLTPREFLTSAQMNKGWRTWGKVTDVINDHLENKIRLGQSADIQNYPELVAYRTAQALEIGRNNTTWFEEWKESTNPFIQAKVMEGFRNLVLDPTFDYKPEWPFIEMYIGIHDSIANTMEFRAESSGNRDYLKLGHQGNSDLKTEWLNARIDLRGRPDFTNIFDRYFSKMETITYSNFPSQFPKKV